MSSLKASEYSAFLLNKGLASELPILKKFALKEATLEATVLQLSWQSGCVYVTSFRLTQNCQEGEEPATELASFTRLVKFIFFQAIIHFTIFNAIISELGACLTQSNMCQEQA